MGFSNLLIANRGEIAVRVMRTAKRLGYRTVAVYSDADRNALHVRSADTAVHIGGSPVAESYLSIGRIIAAARAAGADAIHPGYGFLSENPAFVRACDEAGLVFVGPGARAMELMGNKRAAKNAVVGAGVPGVPGYQGEDQSDERLIHEAKAIGLPVMVKAAAGGGGRGMRLVADAAALPEAIRSARSEAKGAFGDGELILEKAVVAPRHVEIQIFADRHGNAVYLGERDCSVQRRHQKVIEEAPSPAVDARLRHRMGEAAVRAAQAAGYVGAGTVEFLLDRSGAFYFLEMNTRLQVEHPVTELITGLDLVEWQLLVAEGDELPLTQEAISLDGHAIEARVYAEDPARGFLPQTGPILAWELPAHADVRVDTGIEAGHVVGPHYDPLLAKVIAHGRTRDEACRKLASALQDLRLLGVRHNKAFLAAVCRHPAFLAGEATTAFIGEHFASHPTMSVAAPGALRFALAALPTYLRSVAAAYGGDGFRGWRSGSVIPATVKLRCGEHVAEVDVVARGPSLHGDGYRLTVRGSGGASSTFEVEVPSGEPRYVVVDGVRRPLDYVLDGDDLHIELDTGCTIFTDVTGEPPAAAAGAGSGRLTAPLDGRVVELTAASGAAVAKGQLVMVLEAMKMEHRIVSDVDGTVALVHVAAGDQVKTRQLLAEVIPTGEAS